MKTQRYLASNPALRDTECDYTGTSGMVNLLDPIECSDCGYDVDDCQCDSGPWCEFHQRPHLMGGLTCEVVSDEAYYA